MHVEELYYSTGWPCTHTHTPTHTHTHTHTHIHTHTHTHPRTHTHSHTHTNTQTHMYTHTHTHIHTHTHTHTQMHALSPEGTLSMCYAHDPPTLVYLKKQMEQGRIWLGQHTNIQSTDNNTLDILELPGLSRGRTQSQIRASTKIRK